MKNINLKTVTFYKNSRDVIGTKYYNLDYLLGLIKSGDNGLSEIIANLRNLLTRGDMSGYKKVKNEQLPMFAASGNFNYRNSDLQNLQDYSNIVIVDLDWEKPDYDAILDCKDYLIQNADDFHLYAVWLSPGHGVKCAIIHDSDRPEYHYNLVMQIRRDLFNDSSLFDTNCTNIDRTCFLSYDPYLWVNSNDFAPYHFVPDVSIANAKTPAYYRTSNGTGFKHTQEEIDANARFQESCSDKTLMNILIKSFNRNNPDYYKDGNRHKEVKRRAVIFCKDGIHYDNALWSLKGQFGSNSKAGLDDNDIEGMVSSCYRNASGEFGTEREKFLQEHMRNRILPQSPFQ